ncbi:ABC transporter permease [Maridesulfovibrio hydrothermalis]|uniref:ABC transporter permease n=1 Tax=Maridesulfovibrio hydrothermalis TaxID=191026 RepID=UPI001C6594AD|nr:ABC transporter permease [Maridesulfovibrio hydrothermalis]
MSSSIDQNVTAPKVNLLLDFFKKFTDYFSQINCRKVLSPIAVLLIWELVARLGWVQSWFLPAPTKVLETLWEITQSGVLLGHACSSMKRAVVGYSLAAVVGVSLGLLIAWSQLLEDIFDPLIELLRPLSTFALIPIFFLWFGIGETSKIMIIFKSCFFPIALNTIAGIKGVDSKLINAARSLGANKIQLWIHVLIPAALPTIMTGLRISTALSMMSLVGVEMLSSDSGLGFMVIDAQRTFDTELVFAGIMVLSIIGFSLDRIARLVERKMLGWHVETSLGGA